MSSYVDLFFKYTATTESYTDGPTLSLHDARPIADSHRGLQAFRLGVQAAVQPGSELQQRARERAQRGVQRHAGLGDAFAHRMDLRLQAVRSEEHTSELQSLMRISYAVFCLKKKKQRQPKTRTTTTMHTSYN